MGDEGGKTGLEAFEARLAILAEKVRAGFPERARELLAAAAALATDETSARADVQRYAHKIRGTAGSHGFGRLTDVAANVERLALEGSGEALALAARALAGALEREAVPPPAAPATSGTSPQEAPLSEIHAKPALLAGLRIAAVDDDAATRRLLTLTLVNVGQAQATVEAHGSQLLERLRVEAYDVVIVDAMMPEMNGLACLERVVSGALHREGMRYFVLSAATEQELCWSLPTALHVGWLRKPFRPRELVDAIASQLGR